MSEVELQKVYHTLKTQYRAACEAFEDLKSQTKVCGKSW